MVEDARWAKEVSPVQHVALVFHAKGAGAIRCTGPRAGVGRGPGVGRRRDVGRLHEDLRLTCHFDTLKPDRARDPLEGLPGLLVRHCLMHRCATMARGLHDERSVAIIAL